MVNVCLNSLAALEQMQQKEIENYVFFCVDAEGNINMEIVTAVAKCPKTAAMSTKASMVIIDSK